MHHVRRKRTSPAIGPNRSALVVCGAVLSIAFLFATGANAHAAKSRPTYAPHLDRNIIPTRVDRFGPQVATWYGPGLYGNRTACGQTLRRGTWGIAHRTLPCGSLVTITLGARTITVPVIDRGPFSGASVDLTTRTRDFLRFRSGHVRMARVHRYRPLPKVAPTPRSAGVMHLGTTARG